MASSRTKRVLASFLRLSGWFALRSRSVLANRAIILMYHRVLPREVFDQAKVPVQAGMYVTPESLRVHLQYLKTHCIPVSLDELVRRLRAGEDISRCVAVTFDDGWLDNYLYAYPLLREFKVPATVFLTSGFIGSSRWFWPEEISWVVLSVYQKKFAVSVLPAPLAAMVQRELAGGQRPAEASDRIVAEMKQWDASERDELTQSCARMRQAIGAQSERLLMDWEEIKEMAASGLVQLGSHTVSHALLDQIPGEAVQLELSASMSHIRNNTGAAVDLFAYPNGNYDQKVLAVLATNGIKAAVTTRRGFIRSDTPLLELPRIAVHEDVANTTALFQWRLFVR
jgi:peptidoglycan/xylan/chitin deacetylase (PgdA/CDA1 family)